MSTHRFSFRIWLVVAHVLMICFGRELMVDMICQEGATGQHDVSRFQGYFDAMTNIYAKPTKSFGRDAHPMEQSTCIPYHKKCGWSENVTATSNNLPTLYMVVGLEGSGHGMMASVLNAKELFDCSMSNGPFYDNRIINAAFTHVDDLKRNWVKHLKSPKGGGQCKKIFDYMDSFPTGATKLKTRMYNSPDIVNLESLHGVLFNVKYMVLLRNVPSAAMSGVRRGFYNDNEFGLRSIDYLLSNMENALRQIPCERIFYSSYEHIIGDPEAYTAPLSAFFGFDATQTAYVKEQLTKFKNKDLPPSPYELNVFKMYKECSPNGSPKKGYPPISAQVMEACVRKIRGQIGDFFKGREALWPTFAGNGSAWNKPS
jgi:hypothetical protein